MGMNVKGKFEEKSDGNRETPWIWKLPWKGFREEGGTLVEEDKDANMEELEEISIVIAFAGERHHQVNWVILLINQLRSEGKKKDR